MSSPNDCAILQENEQLHQTTDSLRRELSTLRQQFANAVSLTSKFEESSRLNSKYSEQIQQLKAQVDDLKNRLQIQAQSQSDRDQEFQLQRDELERSYKSQIEGLNSELSDQKQSFRHDIDKLRRDNVTLTQNLSESASKLSQAQEELKEVYGAATDGFQTTVSDLQTLIYCFSVREEKQEEPPHPPPPVECPAKDDKTAPLRGRIRSLKRSLRDLQESKQHELEVQMHLCDEKCQEHELHLEELRNQNERLANQCAELRQTKETLIQDNGKLHTQLKCNAAEWEAKRIDEQLETERTVNQLTATVQSLEDKNEVLKKQIQPLIVKMKSLQSEHRDLAQNLKESQEKVASLSQANDFLSAELKLSNEERDKAHSELKALHKRAKELLRTAKEFQAGLNEKTTENAKLTNKIDHLTAIVDTQRSDLEKIGSEREEFAGLLERQTAAAAKFEALLREQVLATEKAESESRATLQKLIVATEPVDEISLLLLAVESLGGFPAELIQVIQDVAKNPTIRPPSKMKQIFVVIHEWYSAHSQRADSELEAQQAKLFETEQAIHSFARFLARLFPSANVDFDAAPSNEHIQSQFENYVKQSRNDLQKMKQAAADIESHTLPLLLELESESLAEAKEKVLEMKAALDEDLRRHSFLKERLKATQKAARAKVADLSRSLATLTSQVRELEEELTTLKSNYSQLQCEFSAFQRDSAARLEEREAKVCENQLSYSAQVQEFESQLAALVDELKAVRLAHHKTQESNILLESELARLETTNKLLNSSLAKRALAIQRLKKKAVEVSTRARQRIESERELNNRKLEKVVSRLEEWVSHLEVESAKWKQTAAQLEARNAKLRAENDDLSIRLQSTELKMARVMGDFERERKLMTSQMKTEILSSENVFQSKLEEYRVKILEAKRHLIDFVIQQFRTVFEVTGAIDDSQFEAFLRSVAGRIAELVRSEANLRQLLNLGPKQSIEDAVSSLLLRV
jgi:chromosome segregation ATPase